MSPVLFRTYLTQLSTVIVNLGDFHKRIYRRHPTLTLPLVRGGNKRNTASPLSIGVSLPDRAQGGLRGVLQWVTSYRGIALLKHAVALSLVLLVSMGLSSCDLPQVRAEERIFLNLKLDFLDEYQWTTSTFDGTRVGGLSGITYDRSRGRFYAVSDDRSQLAPARFYTLKLDLKPDQTQPKIEQIVVEQVTRLKNRQGEPYPASSLDPEGIVLTQNNTVLISSEGVQAKAAPFIDEFDLQTGQWQQALPIPPYFSANPQADAAAQGVGNNLGFEALTIAPQGDRVFAATESALVQDLDPANPGDLHPRLLHYLLTEPRPQIVSEHLYELEPTPEGASFHGLAELLAIDNAGHFLSLERTFSPTTGISVKVFQIATGAATDVSGSAVLKGKQQRIRPVRKQLLIDLSQLGRSLENLEGITFGPRLVDGSQTLLMVSDNNFLTPTTQFLLFRYQQLPQSPG
jgi:hypothetical protein